MRLYSLIYIKRKIEELIMWPFVYYGKQWAKKRPLEKEFDLFFFFPGYGLGGGEKVNLDIINCFTDKKIIIFFTKKCENVFFDAFNKPFVKIIEISKWTDNKKKYWNSFIYRGICAEYINSQKLQPIVFNGQCNFAYKLFPHLRKNIKKIELIHVSEKKFAWITFPYVEFIDTRVMVSQNVIEQHRKYYDELGIPTTLKDRMVKVLYTVKLPYSTNPKNHSSEKLKVYYAGRGGYQKRLYLLFKIIHKCFENNLPIEFTLAGSFKEEIPENLVGRVTYLGVLKTAEAMEDLHNSMDVYLMTSAFEGFPKAMMEAMAVGVVPVAPDVDGIPENITHDYNGLLITNPEDENGVVEQGYNYLVMLINDKERLKRLSDGAFEYAMENFNYDKFKKAYREIILGES